MGLFDKVKNILFEEEEVEEEVVAPKEKEYTAPVVEEVPEYKPINEIREEVPVRTVPTFEKPKEPSFEKPKSEMNDFSERDLFRNESTFKFPAFDEEEFNTSMPKTSLKEEKPAELEYEKRKQERRNEYSRLDAFKAKEEVKEEKKRFKPSPVISPVYGILDKDYKAEDIMEAPKNNDNKILTSKDLDVDSVRAKAFGKLESKLKEDRKTTITHESYEIKKEATPKHEKKVEVKKEEEKIDDVVITDEPILDDSHNLIEERAKTIDELLKDASDDVIDTEDTLDITTSYDAIESAIDSELDKADVIETTPVVEEEKNTDTLDNDTLENDLYDLIDSMYDNTEDGE